MDDNKVYTNETIPDTAFPIQPNAQTVTDSPNAPTTNVAGGSATIPQQGFPTQPIAVDVVSQVLNTKTKKIIQEFQFAPSGAIQIGNFEQGVAGDIRISPSGFIARNLLGDTTIAIDGDTGDAIFAGEVRSGTTITGDVTILGGGHILMYDTNGIPNIFIGEL